MNPSGSVEENDIHHFINTISSPPNGLQRKMVTNFDNYHFNIVTMPSNTNRSVGCMNLAIKCSCKTSPSLPKRVTIHMHHPVYMKENKKKGNVILFPKEIQELLKISGKYLFYI